MEQAIKKYLGFINEIDTRIADKKAELESYKKAIEEIKTDNKAVVKGSILGLNVSKKVNFDDIPGLAQKVTIADYQIEALEEMKFGQEVQDLAKDVIVETRRKAKRIIEEREAKEKELELLNNKVIDLRNEIIRLERAPGYVLSDSAMILSGLASKLFGKEKVEAYIDRGRSSLILDLFEE